MDELRLDRLDLSEVTRDAVMRAALQIIDFNYDVFEITPTSELSRIVRSPSGEIISIEPFND